MASSEQSGRTRDWVRNPIVWLVVGLIIGLIVEPIVPDGVRNWIDHKRDWVLYAGDSGDDDTIREVSLGDRPQWCPRWANWKLARVPRYNQEAPTCDADESMIYAGVWTLPDCIQRGPLNQLDREGLIRRSNGTPDLRYYTTCYDQ